MESEDAVLEDVGGLQLTPALQGIPAKNPAVEIGTRTPRFLWKHKYRKVKTFFQRRKEWMDTIRFPDFV